MSARLKIALIGAGLIGRRHADLIAAEPTAELCALADPAPAAAGIAQAHGVPCYASLNDLLAAHRPDGLIIATPNALHAPQALAAIAQGIPLLVEKPLADSAKAAATIVEAAEARGVPLLVGHHRRHNPLVIRAKAEIAAGHLGRLVAVHGQFWLHKPDDYFDADWRRQPGAGPVLINLIHDIDLMRHLCGNITTVQAVESSAVRGFAVEDSAAALFQFASGALGTLTASDTISAPWSWEMTAHENPVYPATDQHCYLIGGTHGSLSLPLGVLWQHTGARSWWEPIAPKTLDVTPADPLTCQMAHFCAVIRGEAPPLVTGRDGLAALQVIDAIKQAAATGQRTPVAP
ncbi:MAG: Gfo/Idh/MocA family oxidoreductase [Pseudomonadota bacterium]